MPTFSHDATGNNHLSQANVGGFERTQTIVCVFVLYVAISNVATSHVNETVLFSH